MTEQASPFLLFAAKRGFNYRHLRKLRDRGGLRGEMFNASLPGLPSLRLRDWREADVEEMLRVHLTRRRWHRPWLFKPLIRPVYFVLARFGARYRYCVCVRRLRKRHYDALVLWNGHRMPEAAMRQAALRRGQRVIHIENGVLPFTRIADPVGVNAFNSLPRDPEFYRRQPLPAADERWKLAPRPLHRARDPGGVRYVRELPEKYLFAPFQIDDDTQVILHSTWIRDMEEFFAVLCDLRKRLAEAGGEWADTRIVVKEHPTSPWGWEKLHADAGARGIIFANGNETQELIEKSRGVLTINSSVGIEAMLFGKPVILLGNAFYALPGLVQQAGDRETLCTAVGKLDAWRLDTDLRDRFIHYLETHYCVRRVSEADDDWPKLADRIRRMARGDYPWKSRASAGQQAE